MSGSGSYIPVKADEQPSAPYSAGYSAGAGSAYAADAPPNYDESMATYGESPNQALLLAEDPYKQHQQSHQQPQYGQQTSVPMGEVPTDFLASFSERDIRRAFLKKVYGLLFLQLLVTGAITCLFIFNDTVKNYIQGNNSMFWSAWGISLGALIGLACCPGLRRKTPHNYIFLGIFTLAEAYLVGVISSFYSIDEVLIAIGVVAVLVLGLTLFAFQTKYDFTGAGPYLFVLLFGLLMFGFLCIPFSNQVVNMVYASLGAIIFALYLVYDTQIMLGGKHKLAVSPEEYVFAALNLYLDIVNLFLYILAIVGGSK